MGASKAKNSAKRRELNREKRARQAQRRAEREHPNAAAIAPVRARLDAVLERKSRHVMGHGDVAKSLTLIERMRAEGAEDPQIDEALAQGYLTECDESWQITEHGKLFLNSLLELFLAENPEG